MAGNPFDQFDASTPNPFDQFDSKDGGANPFDQFDVAEPAAVAKMPEEPGVFGSIVSGLRAANRFTPLGSIVDPGEFGSDVKSLFGGGVLSGTGRAAEGLERLDDESLRPTARGIGMRAAMAVANPVDGLIRWQRGFRDADSVYQPSEISQTLKREGERVQSDISQTTKQEMDDTDIGGDVLSPSTWTLGRAPSVRGAIAKLAGVSGEMAPLVALGAIPGAGPGLAVAGAAGQSASGAYDDNAEYVRQLPDDVLAEVPQFRELIAAGMDPAAARARLADEAGRGAMLPAAAIGAGSGLILSGAATKPFQRMITDKFGDRFATRFGANALEVPLEGAQEVAEAAAGRAGANAAAGTDRDLTAGSFGDFLLGAAAAGPAAAIHSAGGAQAVPAANPFDQFDAPAAPAADTAASTPNEPGPGPVVPPVDGTSATDPVVPPVPAQDPAAPPIAITRAMRDALRARGMKPGEIARMSPARAAELLNSAEATPESKPDQEADPKVVDWRADLAAITDMQDDVRASIAQRYERAEQALPVFDADVRSIAESVGGRAIVAPMKRASRAASKIVNDYAGDASQIKDLVRGTIELPSPADAEAVIAQLRAKYGEPVKLKNSMDPSRPPPFANGYRDMNSVWSINGEPVELQVNVPEMLAAKKKAHKLYEEVQQIERSAERENRKPTPEESARLEELNQAQAAIYVPAWDVAMARLKSASETSVASSRNRPEDARTGLPVDQSNVQAPGSSKVQGAPSTSPNFVPGGNSVTAVGVDASISGASLPRAPQRQPNAAGEFAGTAPGKPSPDAVTETPNEPAVTLQNRDRSRAASVAQMQGIASNPDPSRLSFSRDPNTGAPMASARNVEQAVPQTDLGRADTVIMPSGRRIPVRYAVVEADSVAASHRADGSVNPGYEGAPIRALNNGRVAGLQSAWQRGNADGYRQGLIDDASMLGIDPEAIQSKRSPVLVRLYGDEHNQGDMGAESNASSNLGLSPVEQANTDARALPDLSELPVTDSGELSSNPSAPFYRQFLQALGANESAKLVDGEGRLNKVFFDRLRGAVFARAYGHDRMIAAMAEDADPDARNVLHALVKAAPEWARVERDGPLGDYAKRLVAGFETLRAARESGQSVESLLSQGDMFGRDASGDPWARHFAKHARSSSRMADSLREAAKIVVDAQIAARNGDMFGSETPDANDVATLAVEYVEQRDGRNGTQGSLFGAGGGIANRPRQEGSRDAGNRPPSDPAERTGDGRDPGSGNTADPGQDALTDSGPLDPDDALQSRASLIESEGAPKGIPVDEAQAVADEFMASYNGHIPLTVRVGATLEDIYGPGATAKLGNAKGAYHAKSRVLTLAADRLSSRADAEATLRHEVLGHFGLNTLDPADNRAVLESILSHRTRATSFALRGLWKDIDARYADKPELVRAEEVFALAAEKDRGAFGKAWDDIVSAVIRGLRKIGLVRGAISLAEIRQMIRRIGDGIREGSAEQKTFPQSDDAQFSRSADAQADIRRAAAQAAERAAGRVLSRERQQNKIAAAPKSNIDLRKFDFTPPAAKQGIFAKASQDVRDQVTALQKVFNGRPQNPQSILERLNDTRAAIFDSIMSRARALERRNPKAHSLRKLFNLAMAAPGDSRLVQETVSDAIASRFAIFTNRARNILAANGLENMTEAENASLRETMLGTAKNPLPKVRKAASELRALMNVQREDLIATGVEVGEVTDVGYLTRMYDDAKILSDEAGFLKVAEELYEKHEFAREVGPDARGIVYEPGRLALFLSNAKRSRDPSVVAGLKSLRAAILKYRNGGALTEVKDIERIVGDLYADVAKTYAETRAAAWLHAIKTPNVAQFVNGIGPSGAPVTKERVLSGAADTVMAPYLKTDMLDILDTYGRKVAQKIEHAARFGPKGENLQQLVDSASREGVSSGDLEQAVELVESALGLKPSTINPRVKAGFDFVHAWSYLALLPKAAFSSVMEAVTFSIRTAQLRHTVAPLIQVARALAKNSKVAGYSSAELSSMAQAIGVNGHLAVEEVLMNRLGGDYAMTPRWSSLLHRFFKANLLTPLTRAQRAYGVGAATGYLRSLAKDWRSAQTSEGRRQNERFRGRTPEDIAALLNEVGIADHEAFADWLLSQTGALPDPSGLFDADGRPTPRGQDYMVAVRRIIDQSIQNPGAAHRPAWTNNPTGRLVTGIMSFSYASYENVIKGSFKRAVHGDKEIGLFPQVKGIAHDPTGFAKRFAPILAGAGALVLAQTIASTVRELLFNAARFDDKDDDEKIEELLMLGLSRTFGLGSGDPLVQYLTGLKYQRTLAETALGAGPGLIAQAVDAVGNISSDRNSGNTDTAEYRMMQKVYGVTIAPVMNALLSRVPLIGGPAMIALSDKAYRDEFASTFFTPPEPRSHLDDKYREAVAGVDDLMEEVEGRIALLPKDQWADELDKLKAEYPSLLNGVTLDTYAPSTQNIRAGRFGPKQTKEGKPRLKLGQGDFGSVLGELEGYPYYDLRTRSMKTTAGIEDEIRDLNRAIKNVPTATTQADLISYVSAIDRNAAVLADLRDDDTPATKAQRDAAREELMALRRDRKREAIDLIERGERGEAIAVPR